RLPPFAHRSYPPALLTKGVAMNATKCWLGALLLVGSTASFVQADPPHDGRCVPQAPDSCGPGFYIVNGCGLVYGPCSCLRPGFLPFNGVLPGGARPASLSQPGAPGAVPGAPGIPPGMPVPGYWSGPCPYPFACPPGCPTAVFPSHPFARGPR